MQIEFECDRRRQIAAWRRILWTAYGRRSVWTLCLGVAFIAAVIRTGNAWFWVGASIALSVLGVTIFQMILSPIQFVPRDRANVGISTDDAGITLTTEDGAASTGWEMVGGLNRFGDFWLFDCDNSTIGSQLIPDDVVDDEALKEWHGKSNVLLKRDH
ncbi:MAG: hypothetical protein ACR2RV_23770 [Verrucomicrobiales bacterium]